MIKCRRDACMPQPRTEHTTRVHTLRILLPSSLAVQRGEHLGLYGGRTETKLCGKRRKYFFPGRQVSARIPSSWAGQDELTTAPVQNDSPTPTEKGKQLLHCAF